jgi:SNF2 family DNA or RNA helicase
MPHQFDAKEWCIEREEDGCILALEMGLGKTIVSLSLIVDKPMTTLVIMPLSLLEQWYNEIQKHTSGLKVAIYHGKNTQNTDFNKYDVILTTYNKVYQDFTKRKSGKFKLFSRVIIDEVHKLRNSKTKSFKAFQKIFRKTENKIFLTGTPICNNEKDIISLILLTNRTPYNRNDYWKSFDLEERLDKITEIREDVLLRMTVKDTLPDKLPKLEIIDCSNNFGNERHSTIYNNLVLDDTQILLKKITTLRLCSNESKLVDKKSVKGEYPKEVSDKIGIVLDIVKNKIPGNEKVIIFSQWIKMLELIQSALPDIPSLIYTGKLSTAEKESVIEKFNTDDSIRVLYITLKAGSVGLNLNIANNAIIVEPYFNRAEEDQAMTRIYRIGQTRDVKIYKLDISNSIEQWMKSLQRRKSKISDKILNNTGTIVEIEDELVENKIILDTCLGRE